MGKLCCKGRMEKYMSGNSKYFDGKRVIIKRAPEPTDVYWKNLHLKFRVRLILMVTIV